MSEKDLDDTTTTTEEESDDEILSDDDDDDDDELEPTTDSYQDEPYSEEEEESEDATTTEESEEDEIKVVENKKVKKKVVENKKQIKVPEKLGSLQGKTIELKQTLVEDVMNNINKNVKSGKGKKNQNTQNIKLQTLVVNKKKGKTPEKLEDFLIKSPKETKEFFLMRSQYAKIAQTLFPKYPVTTFVLLGEMGANRGVYGTEYPEETNQVLDYIDQQIKNM